VPPLPAPICRDPDDEVVPATTVAAHADAIVTGDQDQFIRKAYQRIRILTPRAFIEAAVPRE